MLLLRGAGGVDCCSVCGVGVNASVLCERGVGCVLKLGWQDEARVLLVTVVHTGPLMCCAVLPWCWVVLYWLAEGGHVLGLLTGTPASLELLQAGSRCR